MLLLKYSKVYFIFISTLDDQEFDDDEETEWQHYLRASIECIMRVSDVFPDDVLQLVVSQYLEIQIYKDKLFK